MDTLGIEKERCISRPIIWHTLNILILHTCHNGLPRHNGVHIRHVLGYLKSCSVLQCVAVCCSVLHCDVMFPIYITFGYFKRALEKSGISKRVPHQYVILF